MKFLKVTRVRMRLSRAEEECWVRLEFASNHVLGSRKLPRIPDRSRKSTQLTFRFELLTNYFADKSEDADYIIYIADKG
jgi:hypothetical protein